jgi:uncharacterized protein involved in response to NO
MRNFLSYAFRPFFLLSGFFAIGSIIIWMFAWHGAGPATLPADITYWHAHEMLVGFAMAAIAGFLLTAVATWTDRPPVSGAPLALLVLAWFAGRVVMGLSGQLSPGTVAAVDMLFPVLLLIFVGREVLVAGNRRNRPVVFIVGILALFNSLFHLVKLGVIPTEIGADRIALHLLIHLILLLVTVIAGRIVPNFTGNWLRARGVTDLPVSSAQLDRFVIILTVSAGLFDALVPMNDVTGLIAMAAGLAHLIRLSRWRGFATRQEPLLFVLHAAYFWLPAGYLLLGLSIFGQIIPSTVALHALTMGGIAFMVLAVSSRVALAHTGRRLHAARLTVLAYWLLLLAVLLRLLSPYFPNYFLALDAAAAAWILAFGLFVWVYLPILTGPAINKDA